MTEHALSPHRPGRFQLPTLVGGLLIGALVMGALAPLVGSDQTVSSSGSSEFIPGGAGAEAPGAGGVDDGSLATDPGLAGAPDVAGGPGADGGGTPSGEAGAPGSGPASGGGASAPQVARTASDIGITPDTIRVGAMTLNCPGCAAFGIDLDSTATHAEIAKVFVDELNARGGIHGRKLEFFNADYDPAGDTANGGGSERAGCIELTERRKVFAVLMGGANTNACIYQEHKTPLVTHWDPVAEDPDSFNRNEGRLWMFDASAARNLLDWARQLSSQALITKSTKWGLVMGEEATAVQKHFLDEMNRLDLTPTHVSKLPADPASSTVKIAQEVPAMRAKGVTHVLLAENFVYASSWLRESERNGWKPQYVVSDYPNGANDYIGGQMSTGGDWTGAIAFSGALEVSSAELRRHPALKPCIDHFQRATKRTPSDGDVTWIGNFCLSFRLFEQAMVKAGPNPTRRSFIDAMAATGDFSYWTLGGKGHFGGPYGFGQVQWSAKSFGQRKVWRSPCPREDNDDACYVPVGAPYRMAA